MNQTNRSARVTPFIPAIFVAFLAGTGISTPSTGGTITGQIVREHLQPLTGTKFSFQGWRPIKGAEVRLVDVVSGDTIRKIQSDDQGSFSFNALTEGNYGVEAETKQACALSDAIHVTADSRAVIRLRLKDREVCSNPVRFASPDPRY
jgi:hypothetical protein